MRRTYLKAIGLAHPAIARKAALILVVTATWIIWVQDVKADPLLFSNAVALQNQGSTRIDLFSNPGVTLLGSRVTFLVDITGTLPPGAIDTLRLTYREGNQTIIQSYQIPAFGVVPPPYAQLFTIDSPGANPLGVAATLTVDILGSSPDFVVPGGPDYGMLRDSYTYTFTVATPTPEPAAMILLGSGIIGLADRIRRRRLRE